MEGVTENWAFTNEEEPETETESAHVKNPLLIDLVVENIMSYLQPATLITCRLVNKLWKEEATLLVRKKCVFTLHKNNITKLAEFIAVMKRRNYSSSELEENSLLDLQQQGDTLEPHELLFSKVKFDIGYIIHQFRDKLDIFFKVFGSSIKSLTIHCEQEFENRIYTEEFRNLFLSSVPNIEQLELSVPVKITEMDHIFPQQQCLTFPELKSISFAQTDDNGGYSIDFTKHILRTSPNLRVLKVETHNKDVVWRILMAMTELELYTNFISKNLQELLLDAYISQQHLELLKDFGFHLKVLQLKYLNQDVQKETLEILLTKHRTTFKTLILGDYQRRNSSVSQPLLIKIPIMQNLVNLRISDPYFSGQRQLIFSPPINYSEQIPKLRKLCFDHVEGNPAGVHYFKDLFVDPPSPCYTLVKLEISNGLTDPQYVEAAAKMFPNLKKLILRNSPDEVIKAVWKHMYFLIELTLGLNSGNRSIDSLMTGIPEEVCQRIQENKMFSKVALSVLEIIRTEDSICHLKALQSLRIDGTPHSLLTSVTGYFAFCYMESLSSIFVRADVATISRACRSAIKERLHLSLLEI